MAGPGSTKLRAAVLVLLPLAAARVHHNEYRRRTSGPSPHSGLVSAQSTSQYLPAHSSAAPPATFSWGDVNGTSFLTKVLNQHLPQYCGACWAFASLSALSDRLKIARGRGATADVALSMQHVLNCGTAGTCNGGNHYDVYAWIASISQATGTGVAYDSVNPYIACSPGNPSGRGATTEGFCPSKAVTHGTTCEPINVARSCSTFDAPCTPLARYPNATVEAYGQIGSGVWEADVVPAIQAEVYARGPVSCSIDAEPMDNYTGGVITHSRANAQTNHVVSVVGWGTDGGIDYWLVRNSWGESWGEMGFFRVQRGSNLLNLEEDCAWATIGSYTEHNTPCFEDGANCLPAGYTAPTTHAYGGTPDEEQQEQQQQEEGQEQEGQQTQTQQERRQQEGRVHAAVHTLQQGQQQTQQQTSGGGEAAGALDGAAHSAARALQPPT